LCSFQRAEGRIEGFKGSERRKNSGGNFREIKQEKNQTASEFGVDEDFTLGGFGNGRRLKEELEKGEQRKWADRRKWGSAQFQNSGSN